jgi:hypothetical protein
MAKEPQWRSNLEHPGGLMRPFGQGLAGPVPIPSYVQRWIALTSYRSEQAGIGDASMKQLAADILTDACCSYYRLYAPPLPFNCGVVLQPAHLIPTLPWCRSFRA